jgi:hypothetical protein
VSAGKKIRVRSRLCGCVEGRGGGTVDMADDELCVYSPSCIDCIARVSHWPGHHPQGIKWGVLQGKMTVHLMREDFAPMHTPSTLMRKVHASALVGVCDGALETFARYRRSGHHSVAASTCGVVRQSLCVVSHTPILWHDVLGDSNYRLWSTCPHHCCTYLSRHLPHILK